MLNTLLICAAVVLLGLKFGFRQRLREIGLAIDRIVNVLLGLIIGAYALQLLILLLKS